MLLLRSELPGPFVRNFNARSLSSPCALPGLVFSGLAIEELPRSSARIPHQTASAESALRKIRRMNKTERDHECVHRNASASVQNCPAEDHREHANIHRVPRVTIQSPCHKFFWRVNRCGSAPTERCEIKDAPRVDRTAYREEHGCQ